MADPFKLQPLDLDDLDDGKLLVCESCGAVVHADYAPAHQGFHKVAGGIIPMPS